MSSATAWATNTPGRPSSLAEAKLAVCPSRHRLLVDEHLVEPPFPPATISAPRGHPPKKNKTRAPAVASRGMPEGQPVGGRRPHEKRWGQRGASNDAPRLVSVPPGPSPGPWFYGPKLRSKPVATSRAPGRSPPTTVAEQPRHTPRQDPRGYPCRGRARVRAADRCVGVGPAVARARSSTGRCRS